MQLRAGAQHGARRAVAAAQRVLAAEQHVARFAACDQAREPGAVERRVGAAVAAERAGVEADQDHRRGRVGGDGQQRPARAGVVRADVVRAARGRSPASRALTPYAAVAGAACGPGRRERALARARARWWPSRRPARPAAARSASAIAGAASAAQREQRDARTSGAAGDQHGDEPLQVVLAVHQHDLRGDRAADARAPRARCPSARARRAARELDERDRAGAGHRAGAGRERGDVVGVHDALGEAQHHRLDQEPAAEHEQRRQRAGRAGRAAARGRPLGLALLERRARSSSTSSAQREQPEQRERQHPAGLVAEAAAEQPQRAGRAAERDRVRFAARARGTAGVRRGRAGARAPGGSSAVPIGAASTLAGDSRHASRRARTGDAARGRRPGLRRGRSRCIRTSARARCCSSSCRRTGAGRRASVRRRRSTRTTTTSITRPASEQLHDAARERAGRAQEVGERDRRDDQVGGERLRVEREPDEHARSRSSLRQRPVSQARSAAPQASTISRISSGSTPLSRETATNDGNTASVERARERGGGAEPAREHQVQQRRPRARRRSPRAAAG